LSPPRFTISLKRSAPNFFGYPQERRPITLSVAPRADTTLHRSETSLRATDKLLADDLQEAYDLDQAQVSAITPTTAAKHLSLLVAAFT
jgi:hypothetical protein